MTTDASIRPLGPNGYPLCQACHREDVKAIISLIGMPDRTVTTVNLCLDCAIAHLQQAEDVLARHEWERQMNRPTPGCNCTACLDLRGSRAKAE